MSELLAIEIAIKNAVGAALPAMPCFCGAVPQGANPPAILFSHAGGGRDTTGPGGVRIATTANYSVRLVDETRNFDAQGANVAAMDLAVSGIRATVAIAGRSYWVTCHRTEATHRTERVAIGAGAAEYRSAGGVYRFFVCGA